MSAVVSISGFLAVSGIIISIFCFPNLAINCTWNEWGAWSTCPDPKGCSISKMIRTRDMNEHSCGGTPCSGHSSSSTTCDRFSEVTTELTSCEQNLRRLNQKLCRNVYCNNRGTCHEGECICIDGFSGSTCDVRGKWYKNSKK